ncbi:dihydroorotate dehydrogenase [Candidatus Gottesmanbacteria bacterium]|nr:dihydroorotate dehydrogenase [Candidatus Gottesmanbacteria bacterium]
MADLTVTYCGVSFPNPLILPSGIAQEIPADHLRAIKAGAGGITTKSLTIEPREGNPLPRVAKYQEGFLNSVGLRGPGIEKGKGLIKEFLASSPVPVLVSVFATNVHDFVRFASELCPLNPHFLELNLSCPNVEDDMGKALGLGAESASAAVAAVKKVSGSVPILAKLTPNISNIAQVARSCEQAGADGIVAINTAGPGMLIDISRKKPILGAKRGGVSGPAIRPIAVRCVYDIFEAVKIPIIGMGGITTWQDAVEMMMAGATLVGVGSATYFKGYGAYEEIKKGLQEYMEKEGVKNLTELVGAAH